MYVINGCEERIAYTFGYCETLAEEVCEIGSSLLHNVVVNMDMHK